MDIPSVQINGSSLTVPIGLAFSGAWLLIREWRKTQAEITESKKQLAEMQTARGKELIDDLKKVVNDLIAEMKQHGKEIAGLDKAFSIFKSEFAQRLASIEMIVRGLGAHKRSLDEKPVGNGMTKLVPKKGEKA